MAQTLALFIVLCAAAAGAELAIPLTVTENAGCARNNENISTGVPLLPGQVKDIRTLRLLNAEGVEIPAQFRELNRWWNQDNSIRWVLVDFMGSVREYHSAKYTLADGAATNISSPLQVVQTDDAIVVTTGSAQFTINRKKFNLFDRVRIDSNGDGQYEADEEAVSPRAESGSVVEDTFGQKYFSSAHTTEVKVDEAGPVRVCVVAKGMHQAPDGKGYSRGMYGYDIRMHFTVGKNLVRLDAMMNNASPQPIGSPTFEDWSLVTKLNFKPEPLPDDPATSVAMVRVYGMAPVDEALKAGESATIYQDSNGAESWKINPGIETKTDLSSFRGYRITVKGRDGEKVLGSGDQARGMTAVGGDKFGVVVVPRYFWQQFPKAIEVAHDGTVRIGILPREYKAVHWLPDAGGAGQELYLLFYARGLKPPARDPYPRDTTTRSQWLNLIRDRPWPHVVADNLATRLVAVCTREHYAACGALADIGPYIPINDNSGFPLDVTERRYLMTDYLKGNSFGWQVFGSRWEEYKGHSPWNYEPIGSTDYLYNALNTQHWTWWEFGLRRNLHTRNIRACKIDGTRPFEASTWNEFRKQNVCEDWCTRDLPSDAEIQKYSAGKYERSEWWLPNPEHMNLDENYDLYCLFGDKRALEVARNAAAIGGAFVATKPVNIGRDTGWCFRTLLRYRDLTGSDECVGYVNKAMDNFWEVARKNRSVSRVAYDNDWFYHVFARSAVLAYNLTRDERMRDLVIGLAQGRTDKKSTFPTIHAFCWDQTGDERYFTPQGLKYARLGGYFSSCDAWLWTKPRPDKAAPAGVTDLTAAAGGAGDVTLGWTAPGDDRGEGTAAVYQVKHSDLPIVDFAQKGGECSFWAAENVAEEPAPKIAGKKESCAVKGLKPGTYYFALKTRDECNNEGALSNVVKVDVK
jgi:hypothetical protein